MKLSAMTRSRQINASQSRRLVQDPCDDESCPNCYGDPAQAAAVRRAGRLPDRNHRLEERPETD
ncbi:hypothetical protein Ais01nite_37730 [Asanoa ishikariensis]|nr:hypothetical protein Ais01nite_37730 [Asanoa ishikariensis]